MEAASQKPSGHLSRMAHPRDPKLIDLSGDTSSTAITPAESPCIEPQTNTSSEEDLDAQLDEDDADSGSESSLLDDVVNDDQDDFHFAKASNSQICTAAEALEYRRRLHVLGPNKFIYETISSGSITAAKLCTAFAVKPPSWMREQGDHACYPLLGRLISKELSKRRRLQAYQTIDDAAKLLQNSSNVLVITGAGISTSLGIPDFRSKNSGFYSKLQQMGYTEPEEVFTLSIFDEDPCMFYRLAGDILPDLHKFSPTHQFIRTLQDKDKLLTNYTQNIDNIESHAGVRTEKLIQCHGSWATATCRKCGYQVPGTDIFQDVRAKKVAECKRCIEQIKALPVPRPGMKRKRSSNGVNKPKKWNETFSDDDDDDGQFDIPQPGIMKPDITFFGEALPDKFFDRLRNVDRDKADLVIVIGTSMKVAPVSEIPQFIPAHVPQIYISYDPIHHIAFDINLLGDCDTVVTELCRRAGWDLNHKMIPEDLIINVRPDPEQPWISRVERVVPGDATSSSSSHDEIKQPIVKSEDTNNLKFQDPIVSNVQVE